MSTRLRWKMEPRETGLRAIFAGPRSSELHDGTKRYAMVFAIRTRVGHYDGGWYWVAGWDSDVPHKNTCNAPVATEVEAKAAAMAYVKKHLKEQPEADR